MPHPFPAQVKLSKATDDLADLRHALDRANANSETTVLKLQTELAAARDDLADVKRSFHTTLQTLIAGDEPPARRAEAKAPPPEPPAERPRPESRPQSPESSGSRDRAETDTLPYGFSR